MMKPASMLGLRKRQRPSAAFASPAERLEHLVTPRRSRHVVVGLAALAALTALSCTTPQPAPVLDPPKSPIQGGSGEKAAPAPKPPGLEIPYETFKLDNGLTVVVHEDHKAPIVAVNVWYYVGSKNEPEGRSGFAHLFEHLMFQGSENYQGEYFEPFEKVGATDMNGTTNRDRTNYFQNVPTPALDIALWMESDRMGHFKGAITKDLLDEQRGVVKNEKRQGLNRPYGEVWELFPKYLYPKGHPYSHSVIGSMEDLDAATVKDASDWFAKYYHPGNAVIVLAGDITLDKAKERVEHFFGDIPPGPTLTRPDTWVAPMKEPTKLATSDEVPQARVYRVWNVAEWGNPDASRLNLAAAALSWGKNGRLYKRLVYDEQIATNTSCFVWQGDIGSNFMIIVTARPGQDVAAIEKALDEEIEKLRAEGITDEELARGKMQYLSNKVYSAERVGGFGGKSDLLASSQVYGGRPDAWKKSHETIAGATKYDVKNAVGKWLTEGHFTLEVHPKKGFDAEKHPTKTKPRSDSPDPEVAEVPMRRDEEHDGKASAKGADRSKLPTAGTPPDLVLPEFQRAELSNGMKVVLAERHEAPVVRMRTLISAGYSADPRDRLGLANLTMSMLDEGAGELDALAIAARLDDLGASIGTGASIDFANVYLSTLTTTLPQALALYADVLTRPTFPADELERVRKQTLDALEQEQANPGSRARRLLGPLMFGEGHAYGVPLTGTGTESSVKAITREDLVRFHRQWIRPDTATIIVVGDTTMSEIKPLLEEAFADWKAPADPAPTKNLPVVKNPDKTRLFLLNKDDAEQSVIIGGLIAPARRDNDIPMRLANGVLGGQFTSRLNMNLREDKHWAYGSYSFVWSSQNQRLLGIWAPVQTDKTAESLAELNKELTAIVGKKPPTDEELQRLRDNYTLKLPGENETTSELLGNIAEIVQYGLPDDYWSKYVTEVRSLDKKKVVETTNEVVVPNRATWIVVGDLDKIQKKVEKLKLGKVKVLEGEPIK